MRVAIVNALYPPLIFGGAEKSVSLLAAGLLKANHDVYVLSLTDEKEARWEDVEGVQVYRIPISNIYWPYSQIVNRKTYQKLIWHAIDMWNPWVYKFTCEFLRIANPDVMHTNNIRGLSVSTWSAARKFGVPVVHTLRDYSIACARGGMFKDGRNCQDQCLGCRSMTFNKKLASNKIAGVISNSLFTLDRHRASGFFNTIDSRVIFNIGRPTPEAATHVSGGLVVFGYIGRIEEMKGIEILLKAFVKIESKNCKLVIAGQGEAIYTQRLMDRYKDERIQWIGFVDEASFYRNIDVCIVPSLWHEPLPRALIEAFTYGRSAICSDVGGNREIAELGRKVAIYDSADVIGLSEILENAVQYPAIWRLGGFATIDASNRVLENFVVESYLKAYEDAQMVGDI